MPSALFSTPRPEPGHALPALGGTAVLLLALPVIILAGWSVGGWGLAAVLWVAVHVIDVILRRSRVQNGSLAGPGVQAFGLFFKSIGLLVVLIAALAASRGLAVAAALTYALAFTFEFGLSLVSYFGASR
jgi:hypothetical protein